MSAQSFFVSSCLQDAPDGLGKGDDNVDPFYLSVCAGAKRLMEAGYMEEAAAFWARAYTGMAMPALADIEIAGTLITGEMADAALATAAANMASTAATGIEEVIRVEAALDIAAVQVDAVTLTAAAGGAAVDGALVAEGDLIALRAAAIAAGRTGGTVARWIPQGRILSIILTLGLFALQAKMVFGETAPPPKKPETISDVMRVLYAFYLMKSMMFTLAHPTQKYRTYTSQEWRVQVFHPLLQKLRSSAPERAKMRAKAHLDELIRKSQRPDPWKI